MIIDTDKLDTLSLRELGCLLMLYDQKFEKTSAVLAFEWNDIDKMMLSLSRRGYVIRQEYMDETKRIRVRYGIIQKGRQAIADNCLKEKITKKVQSGSSLMERCDILADKLRELYPAGKKPGTAYMWKDSTRIISLRLQKLIENGSEFTDEEAVEATKTYIAGFNGMYDYMQLLKYFISKKVLKCGEVDETSQLMSYIENIRANPEKVTSSVDWEIELK